VWQHGRIWRAIVGEVFFQQLLIQGNPISENKNPLLFLSEFYHQHYWILSLMTEFPFPSFCDLQNISQLASMNYDLITKHNEDPLQSSKS